MTDVSNVTPPDVSKKPETEEERKERERKRREDKALEEGIEESFPASDPPSITQPTR